MPVFSPRWPYRLIPRLLILAVAGTAYTIRQKKTSSAADTGAVSTAAMRASALSGALPRAGAPGAVRELSREATGALLTVVPTFTRDSVRLELSAADGAKLNALIPPVIEVTNGHRQAFSSPGVSPDSSEFLGPVTLTLPRAALPLTGTLKAGFCLAGERLCRLATRTITIPAAP